MSGLKYIESGSKNQAKRGKNLHLATFRALAPFINIYQCGVWRHGFTSSGPRFLITKDEWQDYHAWKSGAYLRDFNPRKVRAKIFSGSHVKRTLEGTKHYYTGGVNGLALFMVDVDAHEDWQDDLADTCADVTDLLPNLFPVDSPRGRNLHMKVDYTGYSVETLRRTLDRLEVALKMYTGRRKCAVEVKGHPRSGQSNGKLAKLPCWGAWDEDRLQEFVDTPTVTLAWLLERVEEIERRPQPEVSSKPAHKKRVKVGSHTGTNVPPEELAKLPEMVKHYRDHAYYLYCRHVEPRRKDVRLNWKDFALALAFTSIARQYVHKAGETPSAFLKLLWQTAYRDGHTDRAFNDSRYAALWRTLADCQFTEVESDRYWHYRGERPGQCMKWELAEQFSYQSEQEARQEKKQDVITAGVPPYHPGVHRPTWVPPPRQDTSTPVTAEMAAEVERIVGFWQPEAKSA